MSNEQQIDLDKLSELPLALGCAALICLISAIVLVVLGLLFMWQAFDEAKLADDIAERGRLVTVEVVGKDITRSAVGVKGSRTTQFWLLVAPPGDDLAIEDAADARVAVSQAAHDRAVIGDHIELWQIDDRFVLDRVASHPLPPLVGYVLLGAGGVAIVAATVLLLVIKRRFNRAAVAP